MISTLEIARQEILLLPRGFHVNGKVIANWLNKHNITRESAANDMRNSLQRMAGHNSSHVTSPRTEADQRVVPCRVETRTIPQTNWTRLGGQGPAQNTGYLITDISTPKADRLWWMENTMTENDELIKLKALMLKKDQEIADLKRRLLYFDLQEVIKAFEKKHDGIRALYTWWDEEGYNTEGIDLPLQALRETRKNLDKTIETLQTITTKKQK